MKREIIRIYRSSKKDGAYLYLKKKADFNALPDPLKAIFGTPIVAMDMLLTPDKKLSKADAEAVLDALEDPGYYLQMPPPKEDYMLDLYKEKAKSDHG